MRFWRLPYTILKRAGQMVLLMSALSILLLLQGGAPWLAANKSSFPLSVASPDLSPRTRFPSPPRETLQHQLLVQEHEGPDMPLDAGGPRGNLPPHQLLPQVQAEVGGGPRVTGPSRLCGLGRLLRAPGSCLHFWTGMGRSGGPLTCPPPRLSLQVVRAGQHV